MPMYQHHENYVVDQRKSVQYVYCERLRALSRGRVKRTSLDDDDSHLAGMERIANKNADADAYNWRHSGLYGHYLNTRGVSYTLLPTPNC
jgi:hypothetical protein